mgnify:FL=1
MQIDSENSDSSDTICMDDVKRIAIRSSVEKPIPNEKDNSVKK